MTHVPALTLWIDSLDVSLRGELVSFGLGTTLTVRFFSTGFANVCVGLSVLLVEGWMDR